MARPNSFSLEIRILKLRGSAKIYANTGSADLQAVFVLGDLPSTADSNAASPEETSSLIHTHTHKVKIHTLSSPCTKRGKSMRGHEQKFHWEGPSRTEVRTEVRTAVRDQVRVQVRMKVIFLFYFSFHSFINLLFCFCFIPWLSTSGIRGYQANGSHWFSFPKQGY